MALGCSKQNWVAHFQSAGLEWTIRHTCLWAYTAHKAKGCNKSNSFVRYEQKLELEMLQQTGFQRGHFRLCHSKALGNHRECFAQEDNAETIMPVSKRTSLKPNSPKEENPREGPSMLGRSELLKCSQAAPSLALAELNKIFHLTWSPKFIL